MSSNQGSNPSFQVLKKLGFINLAIKPAKGEQVFPTEGVKEFRQHVVKAKGGLAIVQKPELVALDILELLQPVMEKFEDVIPEEWPPKTHEGFTISD